jgi:hypothetical protein
MQAMSPRRLLVTVDEPERSCAAAVLVEAGHHAIPAARAWACTCLVRRQLRT